MTLCEIGDRPPRGKGICGSNPQPKHAIASDLRKKIIYDLQGGAIDQRFRLYEITFILVTITSTTMSALNYTVSQKTSPFLHLL